MTTAYAPDRGESPDPGASGGATVPGEPESLGELVGEIADDLQRLLRQEIQLAKAELRESAGRAGRAAGMLAGAGFGGYMVLLLGSLALVFALSNVMDPGWAALIVAVIWAVVAAVLYTRGRALLRTVNPKPERTIDTLKEDAEWARHPTR